MNKYEALLNSYGVVVLPTMGHNQNNNEMTSSTELIVRVLCDERPELPVNGAYLYCQTDGNQRSLFQTALFLIDNSFTSKILILQTEAKCGYPGFSQWKGQLLATGLTEEQIEGVEIIELPILHTLIESEALIHYARQEGLTSLLVVAPPFQQLRAFMTAVTVALRKYPELLGLVKYIITLDQGTTGSRAIPILLNINIFSF